MLATLAEMPQFITTKVNYAIFLLMPTALMTRSNPTKRISTT